MFRLIAVFSAVHCLLGAFEMPMLYNKVQTTSCTEEDTLVEHVRSSWENALQFKSKLNATNFASDRELNIWKSDTPSDHLLNNLCNWLGASHLHVGLLKGGSFVAALYGNQDLMGQKIGLDWFQEFPRSLFEDNCARYAINKETRTIIDGNCFDFDKSLIKAPIDIYFYDADHSLAGHQLAFTYYDDVFSDVFVAVVDDWGCPWVRRPTFKAFEIMNYQILYEAIIPANETYGHGQYVAVIKKSVLSK